MRRPVARRAILALLLMPVMLWPAGAMAAGALTVKDVAADLICQCGCNKVLAICEMQGWAVPAKGIIAEKLSEGRNKEEIIAYFVDQYGPKILAAPPKRGFDLAAWITPFAALVLGGFLLSSVLYLWAGNHRRRAGDADWSGLGDDAAGPERVAYRQRLREELEYFDY